VLLLSKEIFAGPVSDVFGNQTTRRPGIYIAMAGHEPDADCGRLSVRFCTECAVGLELPVGLIFQPRGRRGQRGFLLVIFGFSWSLGRIGFLNLIPL
jgi:hypothetical protein